LRRGFFSGHALGVSPEEVLARLVELARDEGLHVREVGGRRAETDPATRSGVARLRDVVYLVLVASEPLEDRIEVVAAGLREHRPGAFEGRYLPPAVRSRLDPPC
jgi:hypothetical protein